MRCFSLVIFALAVAAIQAAPSGNITDNKVKELADAYIAFAEKATQQLDPLPLKDVKFLPIVTIVPPVGIILSAVNRTISGLSTYNVSNEVVQNKTIKLRITYPSILAQSDYKVGGLYYGRRISGEGHANLTLTNVTFDVSVTLREVRNPWFYNNSYLQIAELNEVVNVGGVANNFTGLSVDGISADQVEQELNTEITSILNLNIPIWERIADATAKRQLNVALTGRNIDDVINWLKKHTPTSSMVQSFLAKLESV